MRNHDQKTKDMIESVLPSAARRSARQYRRLAHHARRVREAQQLHRHLRAGRIDDYSPADAKFAMDIHELVWTRRGADKVGPLTRWAVRRVARDPQLRDASLAEQLDAFRAVLPDDLIGRHALQHIEWALVWESERASWSPSTRRRFAEATSDARVRVMTEQVHGILVAGRHAELNAGIKTLADTDGATPRRPLRGAHDVDDFARDVQASESIRALLAKLAV